LAIPVNLGSQTMHFGFSLLSRNIGGVHSASKASVLHEKLRLDQGAADKAYEDPDA
jgi:hypothetical protein